jgi:hypothetical protein
MNICSVVTRVHRPWRMISITVPNRRSIQRGVREANICGGGGGGSSGRAVARTKPLTLQHYQSNVLGAIDMLLAVNGDAIEASPNCTRGPSSSSMMVGGPNRRFGACCAGCAALCCAWISEQRTLCSGQYTVRTARHSIVAYLGGCWPLLEIGSCTSWFGGTNGRGSSDTCGSSTNATTAWSLEWPIEKRNTNVCLFQSTNVIGAITTHECGFADAIQARHNIFLCSR